MAAPLHRYRVSDTLRDSPTMNAAAMAKAATARGKSVQVLTIGDLFPKPEEAEIASWLTQLQNNAKQNPQDPKFASLRQGPARYAYSETYGLPSLRATIAECFTRDTGLSVNAMDCCIGTGGKGALNGALAIFRPGDVVLLAAPGWPTNYDMFPPGVLLVEIATGDGILRAAELSAALAQYPNPAAILINAPCNPTGANYVGDEREAFFRIVGKQTKTTLVLSDDPYGKLVFEDAPYDIAAVLKRGPAERDLFEAKRLAYFRTVSKEYGLAGLRVGWVISKHAAFIESLKKWNESKGGGMGVENQLEAQAALLYGDGFITRTVAELTAKRGLFLQGIGTLQYATLNAPLGTIYGWVDFSGLKGKRVSDAASETGEAYTIATPADMNRYLVNVACVCGVPGAPFYAPDSPQAAADWHVRFSFCSPREQLQTALSNLANAEKKLENI